jgi:hypothetical protein
MTPGAWGVMCTVSGGATGFRQGWLKAKDGTARRFPTVEDAQAEAQRLEAAMRGRGPVGAMFTYDVVPYTGGTRC